MTADVNAGFPVPAPEPAAAPITARMLVEPGATACGLDVHDVPAPTSAELVIGPEGGWTMPELRAAEDAGACLVTLGALTLRADAVPVVALTAIRTAWRDLS